MANYPDNAKLDESEREQLVAYLDGELAADEGRQIEQRLADDDRYRIELKQFDEAWELLDQLPRAEMEDGFTRTTVAMVALAAEQDARVAQRSRRWRTWIGWSSAAAALVATAMVGFVLVQARLDRPNRQLVRDLPVIENVDVYRYAENVEWLEMLDESGLFSDDEELEDAS